MELASIATNLGAIAGPVLVDAVTLHQSTRSTWQDVFLPTAGVLRSSSSASETFRTGRSDRGSCFITTHYARNLGFVFDEQLTFSDQISSLSKSCYFHIREFRCVRSYDDSKTASTIAASIVHSKLDCGNSLYYNLSKTQIIRLQQIRNCLARPVVKAPKSSLVTPILRFLHCTGSRLMNASNINSYQTPTNFSLPANRTIYTILSQFSLHVEPARHLLSP